MQPQYITPQPRNVDDDDLAGLIAYLRCLEDEGEPVDWRNLDNMLQAEWQRENSIEADHEWIRRGC